MGRVSLGPFNSHPLREACATLDELTNTLREAIEGSATSQIPGCTSCELSLSSSALIPLVRPAIGPYAEGGDLDLPAGFKTRWQAPSDDIQRLLKGKEKKAQPLATVGEVVNLTDPTERSIVQRAASRGIEAAIEGADGFRYSFNNAWASKDQDGLRFSYICQDSMQNKDRHANGHARTLKQARREERMEVRKPTYDCKGSISVKCSMNKNCIEVFYRHFSIHPTVEERKSMPKPPVISTQSLPHAHIGQQGTQSIPTGGGGLIGALQGETSAFTAPPNIQTPIPVPQASNVGKPLKRKRDEETPVIGKTLAKSLSLAELLKQSDGAQAPAAPSPATQSNRTNVQGRGVQYDLPSWEQPPPMPIKRPSQPSQPVQMNGQYPAPYQPPYTATKPQKHSQPHPNLTGRQLAPLPPTTHKWRHHPQPKPPENQSQQSPQGLFMTLKAMPPEQASWQAAASTPISTYTLPTQQFASPRNSCTNCRNVTRSTANHGKMSGYAAVEMNCDGGRPVCGNCLKAGRFDCQMEGELPAVSGEMRMQGLGQGQVREESPDPWFPKR